LITVRKRQREDQSRRRQSLAQCGVPLEEVQDLLGILVGFRQLPATPNQFLYVVGEHQ
jgi:hypothetical protein